MEETKQFFQDDDWAKESYHFAQAETSAQELEEHFCGMLHRRLPKQFKKFELWEGHGVVGNPRLTTDFKIVHKVQATNIAFYSFVLGGVKYNVNQTHNAKRALSFEEIEEKIDEYAVEEAIRAKKERAEGA